MSHGKLIGGKAANLQHLQKAGLPVPPLQTLDTSYFQRFLPKVDDILGALNPQNVKESSYALYRLIEQTPWPMGMAEQILSFTKTEHYYAIRSSAVDEDGGEFSFAGQMDSFLYVKGEQNILQAVKNCFASAFSERVLSYRLQNKLTLKIELAVIIQEMIFGEVSGVLFTANPQKNEPDEKVISSLWGIGEGVVGGELNADTFILDSMGKIKEEKIVLKEKQITFNQRKQQGSIETAVAHEQQQGPSLSPAQLQELFSLGEQVEALQGHIPQDIEWTFAQGKLYLLQSRPITSLQGVNRQLPKIIWDNSNIIESYNGVTTPLTFSFASYAYENVYRQFYSMMGTSERKIKQLDQAFKNMLGLYQGQIYYKLNYWYETLALLPGYDFNREFMEGMMGTKDKAGKKRPLPSVSFFRRYTIELPLMLKGIALVLWQLIILPYSIKIFKKHFALTVAKVKKKALLKMNATETQETYHFLQRELLLNWKTPIVNDLFTMIFYGVLKKIIKQMIGHTGVVIDSNLQNDLLCGEGGLESVKPTKDLIELVNWIRGDQELSDFILHTNEESILWEKITTSVEAPWTSLYERLQIYLDCWGFRCMNELKLEEDSLKENPLFLLTMMKNYLAKPPISLSEMEEKERGIRLAAEEKVNQYFASLELPVWKSKLKRRFFYFILRNARRAIKNREELRFTRTKIFGLVREIFNHLGHLWVQQGHIEKNKDIYFLTVEEVWAELEGRSSTRDIKQLIQLRKKEYEHDRSLPEPPERFYTYYPLYQYSPIVPVLGDQALQLKLDDPQMMAGTPCCPGLVKARCRVILGPHDGVSLAGEILITKRTDPGWVPLFPSISGLIVERGSILSHSAVVAREMGIPTIVSVSDICSRVKDGDIIAIDGAKGLIHLQGDEVRLRQFTSLV